MNVVDFWLWLRGKHTIEYIVRPVGPVIKHLHKHEARHGKKAVRHSSKAEHNRIRGEQSQREADRAKNTSVKLSKLVGGE